MPDINDIHRFYEANLPGYQRRDIVRCNKAFLLVWGKPAKKPVSEVLWLFESFKEFVVFDWQGEGEIRTQKLPLEPISEQPKRNDKKKKGKRKIYGKCKCGGEMVKRQNRSDKSYFLGCSTWPKCTNTKPLLH
jgi:hypothetical protein